MKGEGEEGRGGRNGKGKSIGEGRGVLCLAIDMIDAIDSQSKLDPIQIKIIYLQHNSYCVFVVIICIDINIVNVTLTIKFCL